MTSQEDTEFKSMITKVFALKNVIDTVVDEIKSGEYNPEIIKKLSMMADKFSKDDDDEEHEFKPSSYVVNNDTEDEDDEMEMDDDGPQFVENEGDLDAEFEKLQELLNRRPTIVKKTDKLAEEFLNNTISYSKNIHTKNDFYKSCVSY